MHFGQPSKEEEGKEIPPFHEMNDATRNVWMPKK